MKEVLPFVAGVGVRGQDLVQGRSTRKGRQSEGAREQTPRLLAAGRGWDVGTTRNVRLKRKADGVGDAAKGW